MSNDSKKTTDQTWSNPLRSDQAAQEKDTAPTAWDRMAAGLSGVASFAGEFAKDAVHSGLQEFVSRAIVGDETYSSPQPGEKDPEPELVDHDYGIDR